MTVSNQHSPALRFAEFSSDWQTLSVQKLVDDGILDKPMDGNHGNIHPVTSDFVEDGIRFILANDIRGGVIDFRNCRRIKNSHAEDLQKGFSISGDVLLTHKATLGEVAVVGEIPYDYIMLTPQVTYYRVLDRERLHNIFLYQLFQTDDFLAQFRNMAGGGTRLYIGITEQRKLKLSIPTIEEQQKIASFLSAVDQKIAQLQKKKELLERYKKGCMQKLFSQEVRFKDDDGQSFPDWEEKKLGGLGKFVSGVGFPKEEQGGSSGIPFLKVSDMNLPGNELRISRANHYVSIDQISRLKLKPITEESIIFAKVGAAVFLERKRIAENFLIDNNMMSFTPHKGEIIIFLKIVFDRVRLSRYAQVGALPSYNAGDLRTIKISMPHPREQLKIAGFLSLLDEKIAIVSREIDLTTNFKKGLLQQMFV